MCWNSVSLTLKSIYGNHKRKKQIWHTYKCQIKNATAQRQLRAPPLSSLPSTITFHLGLHKGSLSFIHSPGGGKWFHPPIQPWVFLGMLVADKVFQPFCWVFVFPRRAKSEAAFAVCPSLLLCMKIYTRGVIENIKWNFWGLPRTLNGRCCFFFSLFSCVIGMVLTSVTVNRPSFIPLLTPLMALFVWIFLIFRWPSSNRF